MERIHGSGNESGISSVKGRVVQKQAVANQVQPTRVVVQCRSKDVCVSFEWQASSLGLWAVV